MTAPTPTAWLRNLAERLRAWSTDREPLIVDASRLADNVLAAPVVALTAEQRATMFECPACAAISGTTCVQRVTPSTLVRIDGRIYTHPARLDAAPTHVRLVACDGDGE